MGFLDGLFSFGGYDAEKLNALKLQEYKDQQAQLLRAKQSAGRLLDFDMNSTAPQDAQTPEQVMSRYSAGMQNPGGGNLTFDPREYGQQRQTLEIGAMGGPLAFYQAKAAKAAEMAKPVNIAADGRYVSPDRSIDISNPKPIEPERFKPTNMQMPGTNNVRLARTQEEFDVLAGSGYAQAGNSVPGAPTAPSGPQFNPTEVEGKLRGEFDTKTKDFGIVRDAFGKIQNVVDNPSPAGDISLIFSYMKLLDPGSTVREGEYATAQNAGSIPTTILARYNKAVDGETLAASQRADFVNQASNLYESQLGQYNNEVTRYTDLAKQYNLDPKKVVYDRTGGLKPKNREKSPPPGPAPLGKNGKPMKWVPN